MKKKANIQIYLKALHEMPEYRQRLGRFSPVAGTILILSFAIFLLPLYVYLLFFNVAYFWLRRQRSIARRPFFRFDRHRISHLSLTDKLWCEYCEWANGSLQWALAVTNEIERRYCPIRNAPDPHCETPKQWREEFLDYDHSVDDLESYYKERYPKESKHT